MSGRETPVICTMCGIGCTNWLPTAWDDDKPYCGAECLKLARAVAHSIPSATDRAIERDHSLCGVDPCSDCR